MKDQILSIKKRSTFPSKMKQILLGSKSIPDSLVNLMLIIQIGSIIIHSDFDIENFLTSSFDLSQPSLIIMSKTWIVIELLVIISIQLIFGTSFYRLTYLKCFSQFHHQIFMSYVIIVLAAIGMIIDVLKTTTTLLHFKNKWSEQFNQLKIIGYLVNITGVILVTYQVQVASYIMTILYAVYYIIRLFFKMTNSETQFLVIILSLSGMSVHLNNILRKKIPHFPIFGLVPIFFGILISGHILQKYVFYQKLQKTSLSMKDLHKNQQFVFSMLQVSKYLSKSHFDTKQAQKLRQFFNKNSNNNFPLLNKSSREQYLKGLYNILVDNKQRYGSNIKFLTILGQIQIIAKTNVLGLMKIINEIKLNHKLSFRSVIIKIEIFKLNELLKYTIQNYSSLYKKHYSAEMEMKKYLSNFSFIQTLNVGVQAYHVLFKGLAHGIHSIIDLDNKLNSIVQAKKNIQSSYKKIAKYNCKHSAWLYFNYLKYLSKDQNLMKQILFDLECLKKITPEFTQYHRNIFLCASLEGTIRKIGSNCLGLIGYHRKQLEGQSVSKLVPRFCRSNHKRWLDDYVNLRTNPEAVSNLVRWHKSSVCEDSQGILKRIRIELNLFLVEDQIRLRGQFILNPQIKQIIAFKEDGQILMTGDFQGEVKSKYIQSQVERNIKDIIIQLQLKKKVQFKIIVGDDLIVNDYGLMSMIQGQNDSPRIYIVQEISKKLVFRQNELQTKGITISNEAEQQTNVQKHLNQLSNIRKQYKYSKYTKCKFLRRVFLIFFFVGLLFITAILIQNTNISRNKLKLQTSRNVRIFECTSLYIVNIVGRTFHTSFTFNKGVFFKAYEIIPVSDLFTAIGYVQESFTTIESTYQPMVVEHFHDKQILSSSLLITQTIIQIFDWILTELVNNSGQSRYIELIQYTSKNTQTLLLQLLPLYEQQLILDIQRLTISYRNFHIVEILVIIVFTLAQSITIIVLNCHIKKDEHQIVETIWRLQKMDLSLQIEQTQKFLSLIQCLNVDSNSPDLRNKQDIVQNFDQLNQRSLYQSSVNSEVVSVRQFMPNDQHKLKTKQYEQRQAKLDNETNSDKKEKVKNRLMISLNYILYLVVGLLFAGVCTNIGFYFYLTQQPYFPIINFVKSMVSFKGAFYQYQVMFTSLLLNLELNNTKIHLLEESMTNFTSSTDTLKQFNQDLFKFQHFNDFNQMKKNVDLNKICEYMKCLDYFSQFNVTYYESRIYSFQKISYIYEAIKNDNITVFNLTDPKYQFDYLIYASQVYMQIINKTFQIAFDDLNKHLYKMKVYENQRISMVYILTFLFSLLCVYQVISFAFKRKRILSILQIFKVASESHISQQDQYDSF